MKLSEHFTLAEFVVSDYATRNGLDNRPPEWVIDNLIRLATALETVRDILGHPILITSGYRSPLVNKGVGSSRNSAHCKGLAADIKCPGFGGPTAVCREIILGGVMFDQLIHEGTWTHFAIPPTGKGPRKSILTAHFKGGTVSYTAGLPA